MFSILLTMIEDSQVHCKNLKVAFKVMVKAALCVCGVHTQINTHTLSLAAWEKTCKWIIK